MRPPSIELLILLVLGCGGPPVQEPLAECGDPCTLGDANNYTFASELDVAVHTLLSKADVRISWPDLTTDLLGQPLEPVEIDLVTLIVFPELTPDEAAVALGEDTATQALVGLYQVCEPTDFACRLSEFGLLGSHPGIDQYFEEGTGSWLLALGQQGAANARAMVFLQASDAATDTEVVVTDDSYHLTAEVDLGSLTPVRVPQGTRPILDWSGLTRDGFGHDMEIRTIDTLEVARYDESVAQLEEQFLDIEQLADERWSADVSGNVSYDLADLTDGDLAFPGFDADGTWVIALRCSSCFHPAPRFMTVVSSGQGEEERR